jgi:hypothetical protein
MRGIRYQESGFRAGLAIRPQETGLATESSDSHDLVPGPVLNPDTRFLIPSVSGHAARTFMVRVRL